MYAKLMNTLKETDLVIAEMSSPSTGQGMELQEAVRLDIPKIIVAKEGSKISTTVLDSGKVKATFLYNDNEDIKGNLEKILENF